MARPATKINPVKKTYNLERRSLELLEEMARQDKRSPSMTLELLIMAEWQGRQKKS